jgi:hypothetical protein
MDKFNELIEDESLRKKVVEIYTSSLTEEIDKQVGGLTSKNTQLLDEVKKTKLKFNTLNDSLKDFDLAEAKKALALVNSEEGKLLKDGKKLEELVEVKVSSMKSDYETKLAEKTAINKENRDKKRKWRNKYQTKTIDDTIRQAALTAKVRPEALEDVITRGRSVFAMSEDGRSVEARDGKGDLLKVGDLIANPKNWVESLKNTAPHYWPGSTGAGFTGEGAGGGSDNHSKMLAAAKSKDMKAYRHYKALVDKEKG